MKTRGEDFIDFLGNGKTEHELNSEIEDLELDEDWQECKIVPADGLDKYPIIKRYLKDDEDIEKIRDRIKEEETQNRMKKGGKKENDKFKRNSTGI